MLLGKYRHTEKVVSRTVERVEFIISEYNFVTTTSKVAYNITKATELQENNCCCFLKVGRV